MMSLRKIHLELELDKLTGVYTVTSPDVPGLVTEGSTPEEIQRNVQDALEALFEAWAAHDREIPEALREEINETPITIQTLVRVDPPDREHLPQVRESRQAYVAGDLYSGTSEELLDEFILTPEEIASEQRWDELFAHPRTEELLERLAENARAERRAGKTQPLDPDQL